jgi:hypothetical protein
MSGTQARLDTLQARVRQWLAEYLEARKELWDLVGTYDIPLQNAAARLNRLAQSLEDTLKASESADQPAIPGRCPECLAEGGVAWFVEPGSRLHCTVCGSTWMPKSGA